MQWHVLSFRVSSLLFFTSSARKLRGFEIFVVNTARLPIIFLCCCTCAARQRMTNLGSSPSHFFSSIPEHLEHSEKARSTHAASNAHRHHDLIPTRVDRRKSNNGGYTQHTRMPLRANDRAGSRQNTHVDDSTRHCTCIIDNSSEFRIEVGVEVKGIRWKSIGM